MKNLIGMVDFVLEQRKLHQGDFADFADLVCRYALFLSLKLELWMLVPCDEDGNVLEEPKEPKYGSLADDWIHEQYRAKVSKYQQAKERCLFSDFKYDKYGFAFLTTKKECGFDEKFMENKTIEYLVNYDLQLIPTAIKKIGL